MNLKTLIKKNTAVSPVAAIMGHVETDIKNAGIIPEGVGRMAVSLENAGIDNELLGSTISSLNDTMETVVASLEHDGVLADTTIAQHEAGVFAAAMASDPHAALGRSFSPMVSTEGDHVVDGGVGDGFSNYNASLEAYDERANSNALMFSVSYNVMSATQDAFGEALYPTVTISPDEAGFGVEISTKTLYSDIIRSQDGTPDESKFGNVNVLRALRDSTVLKNDGTRIYPVINGNNTALFYKPGTLAWPAIGATGETIPTGALAFGKKLSLLGISQSDEMIAKGVMDATDSLDPAMSMDKLFLTINDGAGPDVLQEIVLNVAGLATTNFTQTTQDQSRQAQLSMSVNVTVDATTKLWNGSVSTHMTAITAGVKATINIVISANASVEYGDITAFANSVTLGTVKDVNDIILTSGADYDLFAQYFGASVVLGGYSVNALRSNANRREQGQLVKVDTFKHLYAVPVRSPVTILSPVSGASALTVEAAVDLTNLRKSNSAVTTLLDAADSLAISVDADGFAPDTLGVGRYLVKPYYNSDTINMLESVDSRRSGELADDMASALVNRIRAEVFTMYAASEYEAAIYGNTAKKPTVIIATDTTIANYLNTKADMSILGKDFDVKIVSTIDSRMDNLLFITFGQFDGATNGAPNALHFGTMAWAPEVVVNLQRSRNGAVSKELSVSPRFRHVVNLPILAKFAVSGMTTVVGKITVNHNAV